MEALLSAFFNFGHIVPARLFGMWELLQPTVSAGEASLRSVQLIAVCPMVPFYLCFHMFVV
jgi:hypothetical protein